MTLNAQRLPRILICLVATTALAHLAGCADDAAPALIDELDPSTRARVEQLTAELSELPGELVVTRSTGPSLDDATREALAGAAKLIHIYSDGRVTAYRSHTRTMPGADPQLSFSELGGDIVIGTLEQRPDFVIEREAYLHAPDAAHASGLSQGNGTLWRDSTIGYEIDPSFSNATELAALLDAIGSWNNAVDSYTNQNRVRFVPRYANDGRNWVRFVRSNDPSACGRSQVGNHAWQFSWPPWYSHDVQIMCVDRKTIHHEMAHTAGLFHEQQRCDRNSYVSVTGTGIDCDRYCGGGAQDYVQYNYRSVMHYPYYNVCNVTPITPTATNYRGTPGDVWSATQLDTQDVQSINTMYFGQRFLPRHGWGTYYYFTPQHAPSKAIAVPASLPDNGIGLVLFDRGVIDQQWQLVPDGHGFFELRNRATGKCMEVYGFSNADGGSIVQWDCWGGDNQKWIVAPAANDAAAFDVINKLSGKSLDVAGSGTANGTPIQQWGHHGGANQRFQMIRAY